MKPSLGLDPGAAGALSYRNEEGHKVIRFVTGKNKPKKKIYEICDELSNILFDDIFGDSPTFGVENTHAFERDTPAHAYVFGRNAGLVIGAVVSRLRVDPQFIDPKVWQRFFGLGGKYPSTKARKNAHKKVAQKICPYLKVTLDMADAILIAEYIWRTQGGK